MKTKYLALGIFFLSIGLSSPAQIIKAGLNFANVTITNDGDIDRNNVLTSFQAGITGNIKIIPLCPFANSVFKKKPELADVLYHP